MILPWVRVPQLASQILAGMARRLADDWQQVYGHPVYFLETFIEPQRFRGTCYRAANSSCYRSSSPPPGLATAAPGVPPRFARLPKGHS